MAKRKDPAAVSLGRRGGQAGTDKQNRARRVNGKLGGRPLREQALLKEAISIIEAADGTAIPVAHITDWLTRARAAVGRK